MTFHCSRRRVSPLFYLLLPGIVAGAGLRNARAVSSPSGSSSSSTTAMLAHQATILIGKMRERRLQMTMGDNATTEDDDGDDGMMGGGDDGMMGGGDDGMMGDGDGLQDWIGGIGDIGGGGHMGYLDDLSSLSSFCMILEMTGDLKCTCDNTTNVAACTTPEPLCDPMSGACANVEFEMDFAADMLSGIESMKMCASYVQGDKANSTAPVELMRDGCVYMEFANGWTMAVASCKIEFAQVSGDALAACDSCEPCNENGTTTGFNIQCDNVEPLATTDGCLPFEQIANATTSLGMFPGFHESGETDSDQDEDEDHDEDHADNGEDHDEDHADSIEGADENDAEDDHEDESADEGEIPSAAPSALEGDTTITESAAIENSSGATQIGASITALLCAIVVIATM